MHHTMVDVIVVRIATTKKGKALQPRQDPNMKVSASTGPDTIEPKVSTMPMAPLSRAT